MADLNRTFIRVSQQVSACFVAVEKVCVAEDDGILRNNPDALLYGVELALNHAIARFGTSTASKMESSAREDSSISDSNSQHTSIKEPRS